MFVCSGGDNSPPDLTLSIRRPSDASIGPRMRTPNLLAQAVDTARTVFRREFGRAADAVAFAPGRVNLIGEHTDYNDGFVLPMAIEQGIAAAFTPNRDGMLRVHAADFQETREIPIDDLRHEPAVAPGWFRYVVGMAAVWGTTPHPLTGVDIALASTLPVAAGLSSSAALQLSIARTLAAAAGVDWEPRVAAAAAQRSEHLFTGVACGIMDQMAVACGREGAALLLDCRTLATQPVPLPASARVVIVYSGVGRSLAGSAYNERRAACERAVAAIQQLDASVRALRDVDATTLGRASALMDDVAFRRASHVVAEIARPHQFAAALGRHDLVAAGRLMNESHRSLRDLYEVSSPELDLLVSLALEQEGCFGSRLTGAGFGGCTVALVGDAAVPAFSAAVADRYRTTTGLEPRVIVSRPSAGVRIV